MLTFRTRSLLKSCIIISVCIFLFKPFYIFAQLDSITLPEVSILAQSNKILQPNNQEYVISSSSNNFYPTQKLTSILGTYGYYFKAYGNRGLATVSSRGMSASQTLVLWNGLEMNSTFNGVIDFNLISLGGFNKIYLNRSSSITSFGQSVSGGTVWIDSSPASDVAKMLVGGAIGSFGTKGFLADVEMPIKRLKQRFSSLYSYGKNDYQYRDRTQIGMPKERLKDNESKSIQFQLDQSLDFDSWKIEWHSRYILNKRNFSPSIISSSNASRQSDNTFQSIICIEPWVFQIRNFCN